MIRGMEDRKIMKGQGNLGLRLSMGCVEWTGNSLFQERDRAWQRRSEVNGRWLRRAIGIQSWACTRCSTYKGFS